MGNAAKNFDRVNFHKRLRRWTGITSLVLGLAPILIFLGMTLQRGIVYHYGYIRPFTATEFLMATWQGTEPGLAIGGPLLFAAGIAWRWPLGGGIMLLLMAVPFIYGPLASYDNADWAAVFGVVYAILGLLYIVYWWLGRREEKEGED